MAAALAGPDNNPRSTLTGLGRLGAVSSVGCTYGYSRLSPAGATSNPRGGRPGEGFLNAEG